MDEFSNVTEEEMATIMQDYRRKQKIEIPVSAEIRQPEYSETVCTYAEDTGEIAFLRMPCRGNKIICHKIDGHVSFMKVCNAKYCKYFEEKRRSKSQ